MGVYGYRRKEILRMIEKITETSGRPPLALTLVGLISEAWEMRRKTIEGYFKELQAEGKLELTANGLVVTEAGKAYIVEKEKGSLPEEGA